MPEACALSLSGDSSEDWTLRASEREKREPPLEVCVARVEQNSEFCGAREDGAALAGYLAAGGNEAREAVPRIS